MERALVMYLRERNDTLAGRKIELIVADTAGSPATARTKTQELVEKNRVHALTGPLDAGSALAIDDYIRDQQIPTLTVRENLIVARQVRGDTAKSWTLERVLELFPRLQERLQQPAGSLSGGEQQMLAIGRALMGNPRLLLMDEPSEGLAPLIVAEVRRTIARLKAEGQSIVLVEQNIKLALDLADDVVILNTGRVAFAGSVDDVRGNDNLITQHLGVF